MNETTTQGPARTTPHDLEPKLVSVWREGLDRAQLQRDVLAGIVVGVVAFPLAIAFAIASGVRPEQGLVTAVVAGFLIAALGGSRVQIGGPTGAFVVLVYGIVQRHGYDGLAIATLMAGALLVVMGLARLGSIIRFIPYPVTVGFTSGIALIIAVGQLRDAFGLSIDFVPADVAGMVTTLTRHAGTASPWAVGITAATVAIVLLWPRVTSRLPGPLVALVAGTLAVHLFRLPVETIGGRFGAIATGLPMPRLPEVHAHELPELVGPAIAIALLGGIESLLSAVVADGMTGRRHRSNAELVAQGIANLAVPWFGGIPATGAIARTATNVRNGGRTPVAGMVHALVLLVLLLVAGRWAGLIPLAVLAGVLLVVAYHMSEWRVFARLLRGPRSDVAVLLATFLLTVLVDLVVAIQAGVLLAALLFMKRMAEVTEVRAITAELRDENPERPWERRELPAGVEVFAIRGSFFFGSAQKFTEVLGTVGRAPRVVILQMRDVLAIDATGLRALEEVWARLRGRNVFLLIAGIHAQPLFALRGAGLLERIGEENVHGGLADALARAESVLGREIPPPIPRTA